MKIEKALRNSKERFSQFMKYVPAAIFIKDPEGGLVYTNPLFDDAFHSTDNTGKDVHDFFDQEMAERMLEEDRRALSGETVTGEKQVAHADGSIHTYRTYEFRIDRAGEPPLLGGVSVNITESLRMRERLRRSEKMESIGNLAGGIAHDFNNILTGILNAAQLIEVSANAPEKGLMKYTGMIIKAARQAADLTSKLLLFSRQSKNQAVEMNLHIAVDDALDILKTILNRDIEYELHLEASNNTILADRSQIQNVLINLGINSSQAMKNGGVITISTEDREINPAYCEESSFNISPGEYICLKFRDTGCGISRSKQSRIFEPFYTTKEIGTGLGLSTVYGIIREYSGEITVHSEEGKGTEFCILLPLAGIKRDREDRDTVTVYGSGTILLVDDEEMIRDTATKMLESLGYTVLSASDGREAIRIFQERAAEIDLVILDMIMPEMGGKDVYFQLKQIDPECPVAVSSGYSTGDDLDLLVQQGGCTQIPKPYNYSELSQLIPELLNREKK